MGHRERLRVLGDAGAHRVAPHRSGNRRPHAREAVFAGAIEDAIERLGRGQGLSERAAHGVDG